MYTVVFEWVAWNGLARLSKETQDRIDAAIVRLAQEPTLAGSRQLRGPGRRYRIRVGHYRVVYEIDHDEGRVIVKAVGHRRDIYRSV